MLRNPALSLQSTKELEPVLFNLLTELIYTSFPSSDSDDEHSLCTIRFEGPNVHSLYAQIKESLSESSTEIYYLNCPNSFSTMLHYRRGAFSRLDLYVSVLLSFSFFQKSNTHQQKLAK